MPDTLDEDGLECELELAQSSPKSPDGYLRRTVMFLGSSVFWGAVLAAILYLTQHAYEDRLTQIQNQIDKLYGPVLGASLANDVVWAEFTAHYWRDPLKNESSDQSKVYWPARDKIRPEDVERWRSWMKTVFQPMNRTTEKVITDGSAYLINGRLPYRWRLFIRHVEVYQKLISDWKDDDQVKRPDYYSLQANVPAIIYPPGMTDCAKALVDQLEEEEQNVRWTFLRSIMAAMLPTPPACRPGPGEQGDSLPE